jgi:hypothetical protein
MAESLNADELKRLSSLLKSCIRCVARRDSSWMPLSAMKPCWCSPWLLGGWETIFWPGFLTVFCTELSAYWGAESPGKLTGPVSWDVNYSSLFDLFLKTNWLIAYVQSFDLDTLVTPSPRTPQISFSLVNNTDSRGKRCSTVFTFGAQNCFQFKVNLYFMYVPFVPRQKLYTIETC